MREAVKCVNRSTRPTAQFKISVWTRWLYFTKYITAAGSARPNRQRRDADGPRTPNRKHGGRVVLSQADGRARGMRRHSRSARLVYRPFESAVGYLLRRECERCDRCTSTCCIEPKL